MNPTRLEIHRLKYRSQQGKMSLLLMSDLDEAEIQIIGNDFFSRVRSEDHYGSLAEVLAGWGVMCIHPPDMIVKKMCTACQTFVIFSGGKK